MWNVVVLDLCCESVDQSTSPYLHGYLFAGAGFPVRHIVKAGGSFPSNEHEGVVL